jgi:diguanylate cyclase (GGDEF)-like protein/PAS domain S-box-containing protein
VKRLPCHQLGKTYSCGGDLDQVGEGDAVTESPAGPAQGDAAPRGPGDEIAGVARVLIEQSPDAVLVLDADGMITYASPSLESLTGLVPREAIGRRCTDLVHPDDRAALVELFAGLRAAHQGPSPVCFRLARTDATYHDVEAVAMSVIDGTSPHDIVLTMRDVSLRRRIDLMVRSRDEHVQAVLDLLQVGVLICSPEGTIRTCNAAAARMLGRPAEAVVGSTGSELWAAVTAAGGRVTDENANDIEPDQFPAEVSLRTGEARADVVHGQVHPDGTMQWLRFSTNVLAPGPAVTLGAVVVSFEDVTERRVLFLAEQAQQRQGRAVLDALREGVLMLGEDGRVVRSNSAAEVLLGVPPGWLVGRTYEDTVRLFETSGGSIVGEDGSSMGIETHAVVVSRQTGETISGVVMRLQVSPAAERHWLQVSSRPLTDLSAAPPYPVVASFADITESKQAEIERLRLLRLIAQERRFLAEVLDSVDEGIVACDPMGLVTVFNDKMRLFLNLGADKDPTGSPPAVEGLFGADGHALRGGEHPLLLALAGSRVSNSQLLIAPAGGLRRSVLANGHPLRSPEGTLLGAVVALHDVTAQMRLEVELSELALHDPLTGAANRVLLNDRLDVAFERSTREGEAVGVMLVDLDDFKLVNDTLGHAAGDEVLVTCAARLRAAVRAGDTVARLGGDEFVIVCPLVTESELFAVRDRLAKTLAMPQLVAGRQLSVTGSVGVAIELPAHATPEGLLRAADESMYRAKDERRERRGAARRAPPAAERGADTADT